MAVPSADRGALSEGVDNRAAASRATLRPPRMFALAWPSLVENLLLTLFATGSLMMVGHLGPSAMASVGAAGQMSNVLIILFSGIAAGTTALVARAAGAAKTDEVRALARQSLLVGVVLALVCSVIGVLLAPWLIGVLGVVRNVFDEAVFLVRVQCALFPILVVGIMTGAVLRGVGNTRMPMWSAGVGNAANIGVAFVAIYGFGPVHGLGIDGVVAGWIAGQTTSSLLALWALARERSGPLAGVLDPLRHASGWRLDVPVLRRILTVGGPAVGEYASIQVGMVLFSAMVVQMGTAAFAAQQAIFAAANISMLPGLAFSVAATTLVGQHLGAGEPAAARAAGWRSAGAAAVWMTIAGVGFIAFPGPLLGLFTPDPAVVSAGMTGMRMVGLGQPLQAAAFVLSGALRGAGATRTTLLVSLPSMWIVRLGLAWILGIGCGWGLAGIWVGWCVDWYVRGTAYIIAFYRGAWLKVRL